MLPAVIDQVMTASEFIKSGIQKLISLYDRDESVIVMETLLCDTLGMSFRLSLDDRQRLLSAEELQLLNVSMVAVQLAFSIPGAEVTAIDTSEEAVGLTAYNARWNDVKVRTERLDVLTDSDAITSRFDLIVSNPPYIHPTESSEVDAQVLRFEPHLALFTPAEDVLIFYKKILDIAEKNLRHEGAVYFEVNPKHVDKLESVVISRGWGLQKHVDISGKTRIFEIGKIS